MSKSQCPETPKTKMNAFQLMMESRQKSMGTNSNGMSLDSSTEEQDTSFKEKKEARKDFLKAWSDKKGGLKRQKDLAEEARVERILERRKGNLRNQLENMPATTKKKVAASSSKQEKIKGYHHLVKNQTTDQSDDEDGSQMNASSSSCNDFVTSKKPQECNSKDEFSKEMQLLETGGLRKKRKLKAKAAKKVDELVNDEGKLMRKRKKRKLSEEINVDFNPITTPVRRSTREKKLKIISDYCYSSDEEPLIVMTRKSEINDVVDNNETKTEAQQKQIKKKLAPIFLKTSRKSESFQEITQARIDFLNSGVPPSLVRVIEKRKVYDEVEYDIFPITSHVLQKTNEPIGSESDSLNFWQLPKSNLFKLVHECAYEPQLFDIENKFTYEIDRCPKTNVHNNSFSISPSLISDECRNECLDQIQNQHSKFPVRRVYESLKEKHNSASHKAQIEWDEYSEKIEQINLDSDNDVDVDEKVEEIQLVQKPNYKSKLTWVDKYKLTSEKDIIGNTNVAKVLKKWLISWMNAKSKPAGDSSSDFENSDEDNMCTRPKSSVLLIGPCGSGKTSTVYGLCKELRINVLEMNASSRRNGKTILNNLQEATQSHRIKHPESIKNVFHDNNSNNKLSESKNSIYTDSDKSMIITPKRRGRKKKIKELTFKISDPHNKNLNKIPQLLVKNRTENNTEKTTKKPIMSIHNGLNHSPKSAFSLILIEDIDIIFEDEDDGFWNAINLLITASKRPIVMTTSYSKPITNLTVTKKLSTPPIVFTFKQFNVTKIVTWLQIVSAIEGWYFTHEEMERIFRSCNCDSRRCLLYLQFLISHDPGMITIDSIRSNKMIELWNDCLVIDEINDYKNQRGFECLSRPSMYKLNPTVNKEFNYTSWSELIRQLSFVEGLNKRANREMISFTPNYWEDNYVAINNGLSLHVNTHLYDNLKTSLNRIVQEIESRLSSNKSKGESKSCIFHLPNLNDVYKFGDKLLKTITPSCDRQAVSVDYMPYLRDICRVENERYNESNKRNNRFYHYLKNYNCRDLNGFEIVDRIFRK